GDLRLRAPAVRARPATARQAPRRLARAARAQGRELRLRDRAGLVAGIRATTRPPGARGPPDRRELCGARRRHAHRAPARPRPAVDGDRLVAAPLASFLLLALSAP